MCRHRWAGSLVRARPWRTISRDLLARSLRSSDRMARGPVVCCALGSRPSVVPSDRADIVRAGHGQLVVEWSSRSRPQLGHPGISRRRRPAVRSRRTANRWARNQGRRSDRIALSPLCDHPVHVTRSPAPELNLGTKDPDASPIAFVSGDSRSPRPARACSSSLNDPVCHDLSPIAIEDNRFDHDTPAVASVSSIQTR
jgi:hypothetical protein